MPLLGFPPAFATASRSIRIEPVNYVSHVWNAVLTIFDLPFTVKVGWVYIVRSKIREPIIVTFEPVFRRWLGITYDHPMTL
jgi:hypothetical protein